MTDTPKPTKVAKTKLSTTGAKSPPPFVAKEEGQVSPPAEEKDPTKDHIVEAPAPNKVILVDDVEKAGDEANKPYSVQVKELKTAFFDPVVWEQMKGVAETFAKSGAFPTEDNAARLVVKLQAGREMGMSPVESIKSFYFVNGQINIFGSAIMRRLREHGWKISYEDVDSKEDGQKCIATIKNDKGEKYSDSLSYTEATMSGWTKGRVGEKPAWKAGINRRLKLRYGATSMLVKTYVPEVLGSAVDIAEVAMDAAPVYEAYKNQLPKSKNDDKPATDNQIETIKRMGGVIPEDPITFGQAARTILKLTNEKKGK